MFDDFEKNLGLRDHGAGSSRSGSSHGSGMRRSSTSANCSSEAFTVTYSDHISSYTQAGTLTPPPQYTRMHIVACSCV